MGNLFIPPLKIKKEYLDLKKKKVRRMYFQFYFETSDGKDKFRLRAYAVGKKRRLIEDCPPIELQLAEIKPDDGDRYLFPKSKEATELVLGQLELSNVQIKKLLKNVTSEYITFTPREVKINPYCLVYDVADTLLLNTIETANPCPPALPPPDSAGGI